MSMHSFAIRGNVVLPEKVLYNAAVTIANEKVTGIFQDEKNVPAEEILDATGSYIIPGCIDAHVHCFSSPEEGFVSAGRAAAAGGVTTMIEMPYDASGMICTSLLFTDKKKKLEKEAVVDTALLATLKKKDGLDEIPLLAKEGACGFKISMFNTNSVRFPRIDDGEMLDAFYAIAETGLPVGIHAENDEIVRNYVDKYKNEGTIDPRAHCWSRPRAAESTAALTAMELAYWSGVRLHVYHCSFPRIFDLIEIFRSQGTKVTAETCPHYLVLNEEDMLQVKARGKINPPLRSMEEANKLWEQIRLGRVDIITSDHAPWLIESKSNADIFQNSSGAPGVETLLPILYSEGVAGGRITILELVRLLCENPARIFGLDHCKGKIAVGMDADLVIINPRERVTLDEKQLHSTAGWSPFHGKKLQGRITHSFLRGKTLFDGQVRGTPGEGKFVHPAGRA